MGLVTSSLKIIIATNYKMNQVKKKTLTTKSNSKCQDTNISRTLPRITWSKLKFFCLFFFLSPKMLRNSTFPRLVNFQSVDKIPSVTIQIKAIQNVVLWCCLLFSTRSFVFR